MAGTAASGTLLEKRPRPSSITHRCELLLHILSWLPLAYTTEDHYLVPGERHWCLPLCCLSHSMLRGPRNFRGDADEHKTQTSTGPRPVKPSYHLSVLYSHSLEMLALDQATLVICLLRAWKGCSYPIYRIFEHHDHTLILQNYFCRTSSMEGNTMF